MLTIIYINNQSLSPKLLKAIFDCGVALALQRKPNIYGYFIKFLKNILNAEYIFLGGGETTPSIF